MPPDLAGTVAHAGVDPTLEGRALQDAFRAALRPDDATWKRGRGWALWKALITLAGQIDANPPVAAKVRREIGDIVADHERDA